jgi:protein ImuB
MASARARWHEEKVAMYACLYLRDAINEQVAALRRCAGEFSPQIETGKDRVVLDLRGLRRLIGPPHKIAAALADRARAHAIDPVIAIAANPRTAVAAASGIPGQTVIAPGEESCVLGPLPLELLEPEEELADTLSAWGIRTFGELAALPETGIAERLGAEGIRLWRLARGLPDQPLIPEEPPQVFEASMDLDHGVDQLEPLSFVLSRLLNDVCSQLSRQALASNRLRLRFDLDDRTTFEHVLELPFPTRDAAMFLKLLQYGLNARPPQAAVLSVNLRAEPVPPRVLQSGLFVPQAPQSERLEITLTRLAAIVGEENIGSPELLNTHRPGAFVMRRFRTDAPPAAMPPAPSQDAPVLAIRLYRPPLAASVAAPDGKPRRVSARGVAGDVVSYAGPWRTTGGWWSDQFWARDEWDVALSNGAIYRIFREPPDRWFIDGNYD